MNDQLLPSFSRRALVLGGTAGIFATQIGTISAASWASGASSDQIGALANFPEQLPLERKVFRNWDGTIVTDHLWTCTVKSPEDVKDLAQWAEAAGYRMRPRGYGHSWSPVVIENATKSESRVILVDVTEMASMRMASTDRVWVQAGAEMSDLFSYLSLNGRSLIGAPAPGDITVGGRHRY